MNMLAKMLLIMTLMTIAVIMDMRCFKVKNSLCAVFCLIGILYNVLAGGFYNIHAYLLGIITPFIILFPLYALNMLGAGDIKLLCAAGALVGINDILFSVAYSFIIGLVISLYIMAVRRNLRSRLKKVYTYFNTCFLLISIVPYEKANSESDGRMHFTIPIAIGTIAAVIF